ncbi:hypothetical protein LOTGIDRAFT_235205 [Lottia gigantea]|uniref:Uncharacterized protein n=1 Tax=Lottia gigantea TaxID=225164 RepID=V3Z7I2_LOTGI|nr:hypothetical protein LOTGIDRAFT_235205 [Lottia gigantea]ESO86803.1 hypothetical protein LOTGIDRAFT_235205 [Lottia gigantea]
MSTSHSPVRVVLIFTAFLFFLVAIVFNVLSFYGGQELGIFRADMLENATMEYYTEVGPASWTFGLWALIYVWQALWLVYALSTVCRTRDGEYLYTMEFMSPGVFLMFIINLCFNVAWLIIWDRRYVILAFIIIALLPFTLYVSLYFSFSRLYRNIDVMFKRHMDTDVWLVRHLMQNGLSCYAAWVTIATMVSLTTLLTYSIGVPQSTSSSIVLCVIAVEVVIWFLLDVILFDKYTRYVYSPYIVQAVAAAGIMAQNYDLNKRFLNSIFMLCLVAVAGALLIAKIFIILIRHFVTPKSKGSKRYYVGDTLNTSMVRMS